MPQSLSAVYIHLVFSTKEGRPFLRETKLFAMRYIRILVRSQNNLAVLQSSLAEWKTMFISWLDSAELLPRLSGLRN